MFGIGMQELAIILVVALLVLGPRRLPEFARTLGKGLGEFRKASNDLKRSFTLEDDPPSPSPPSGPNPLTSREPIGKPDQLIADDPETSAHAEHAVDGTNEKGVTTPNPDGPPAAAPDPPNTGPGKSRD